MKPIKRNHPESQQQSYLMHWAALSVHKYHDLKWLHSSLNGVRLTPTRAKIAKSQGMKAGISDVFLPTKRGQYSGLYIEMKWGYNKCTEEQDEFQEYVKTQGYFATVCYSWVEAKEIIEKYLNNKL